ncbi:hypothetical protein SVIO_021150 [Streptomyces violaceusniger]|uniref:Peptidase S11 D-alanyl-D-alanine carboxypeptidase A N-terminal domain-containing protein n=1 Tax=Streptomyces violaceusniger TaxID=68280 RepID=A0A4D4KS44_STRVO|nr:hypothetical protein SVIO_021150 [Streptomyces violaceusniger]
MERRGGKAIRRWGTAVIASAAALAVAVPTGAAQATEAARGPSEVSAKGAYLLDNGTNKQLWAKAADTKRPMASTTKLMTAMVVLDSRGLNLNKKVSVKQSYIDYTARVGGSKADLQKGTSSRSSSCCTGCCCRPAVTRPWRSPTRSARVTPPPSAPSRSSRR